MINNHEITNQSDEIQLDRELVTQSFDGQVDNRKALRDKYHAKLRGLLLIRGATLLKAEGVLDDLWQDVFTSETEDGSQLLAESSDKHSLLARLSVMATGKFLNRKTHFPEDLWLANRCLWGENDAVTPLQKDYQPQLRGRLLNQGAASSDADEVLADLWSGAFVMRENGRLPLLAKYAGESPLLPFLSRIATNLFIDHQRKRKRLSDTPPSDDLPDDSTPAVEDYLLVLVREALQEAIDLCDPEAMVMLRLISMHNLSQREIGVLWNRSEFWISRFLKQAKAQFKKSLLAHIKKRDTWLILTLDDILDVCSTCTLTEALPNNGALEENYKKFRQNS